MKKIRIERNQVWRHKVSGKTFFIYGKHGDKWIVTAQDAPKRNGTNSHSLANQTLWTKFELVA